jgi:geranylgeranyl diphosphate synthase type I
VDLREYLDEQRKIVDAEIVQVLPLNTGIEDLYDIQRRFLEGGGKRWRPTLCILVHGSLGGSAETVLPFAAGVELVHNFSLIHDDIEDGDRSRRGKPTLWVLHGKAKAINIGDNMLNKAYEATAKLYDRGISAEKTLWCIRLLCESTVTISEGQAMEMNFLDRWDVSEKEYMEMVWRKTGVLVSAAVSGGAYLADAEGSIVDAMMDYGKLIGPAFQIIDDVLNVSGDYDRYQKEIGGDIREGKKTLMVIHLLRNASEAEREKAKEILARPRTKTRREDCRYVLDLMDKYESIDYARDIANQRIDGALEKLLSLPDSREREMLEQLTNFLVNRDY